MVWRLSPLRLDFRGCGPTVWPKRWVEMSDKWRHSSGSSQCYSLAAFICWTLWKCRNDLLFNHCRWDPFEASQKALTDFFEYQEILRQSQSMSFPSPSSLSVHPPLQWRPPPLGFLKLNFEVGFNQARQFCGGWMILRNHLGQPVKVASVFLSHVGGPCLAEGLVLRECLSLLHLWGYQNVIIEGVCQQVMWLKPSVAALYVVFQDVSILLSVCKGSSLA
ncbi:uncharacterized protein LOC132304599 [Cornus florida]|uniref:uncharacterized protein LOC132304599 n=1 Tax=Cornus florida TaxID=4283 RepID=UPI00289A056A|nr:uncharacterized protein LOC132304599 [Cornus florida]